MGSDDRPNGVRHDSLPNPLGGTMNNGTEVSLCNLEEVLDHRDALDRFRAWFQKDVKRNVDALDCYFAIQGFKQACERGDANTLVIASQLHRKFVSMKTGSCDFLSSGVRGDTSYKVHKCVTQQSVPPVTLFDAVLPQVVQELRKHYALFANSTDFSEWVNHYANGFGHADPRDEDAVEHDYVNEETFEEMGIRHPTTLASSSVVGSSVVDDEAPQASTSGLNHANPHHHRSRELDLDDLQPLKGHGNRLTRSDTESHKMRLLKLTDQSKSDDGGFANGKRHRREGRSHQRHRDKSSLHSNMPHELPEQREYFANQLTHKLNEVLRELNELQPHFAEQIYPRQISEYRQKLDQMIQEQQQQQQQRISGPGVYMDQFPTHMAFGWAPQQTHAPAPPVFHPLSGSLVGMGQTATAVAATSGFDADEEEEDFSRYEERLQGHDRSNSISPAPFASKPGRERHASAYGNGGFAPPPPVVASSSLHKFSASNGPNPQHQRYPTFDHRRTPAAAPQFGVPGPYQSAGSGGGGGYLPHSSNMSYLSYSDSSGVFSAESALVQPDQRRPGMDKAFKKRLFEKAREQSSASSQCAPSAASQFGNSQTLLRKSANSANHNTSLHGSQTLPRPTRSVPDSASDMTVSYRPPGQMAFVSKWPQKTLTFGEFRHLFQISSRTTKRFFFKSPCEDGSDPYQWTAIDRDDQLVPTFEGKVTAEARTMSDSD